jgi:hypothetical protein
MAKNKAHYIWNFRRTAVHYFFLFFVTIFSIISSHNWMKCLVEHNNMGAIFCINIWIVPIEIILIPFYIINNNFINYNLSELNQYIEFYLLISVVLNMILSIFLARFVNYIIDKMTYVEKDNG